jgi:glycosyltransferase involved in cell wall biosynthesis
VAWREKLGLSPSSKLIVQVSKLLPQKGHAVLVEAAPEILARYGDCRILIVGGEAEGRHEYAVGLQRRIAQLGIGDRVTLFGASGATIHGAPSLPIPYCGLGSSFVWRACVHLALQPRV